MHKCLVLCQRKYDEDGNELVNSQINHLVYRLLGIYTSIHYVCNVTKLKGIVDYNGQFGDNEWTESTFPKHSYSLIILNTSPLLYFDHYILKKYLKKDGLIAITIYSPHKCILNIEDEFGNNTNQKILDHIPEFERVYFLDIQDALLYHIKDL